MKTILFLGSVLRATPEEREARRPLGRDPQAYAAMLAELESITLWAEAAGIDAIGGTEHHLQTEGGETIGNSLLLYAKLAAMTRRMIFMPLSIVLPAQDPIRVAENLALFGHLYPGRVQVCFARGYQTRWMQTLTQQEKIASTPMDPEADANNRERFNEYLEVVQKAWAEDSWSYEGTHYQAPFPASGIGGWPLADYTRRFGSPGEVDSGGTIRKIGVVPKPLSPPTVFAVYAASEKTLVDAAHRGHHILIFGGDKDRFRAACELYRDEARTAGYDLKLGEHVGATRKVFIADSYDEAFDLAVASTGYWYNNFFGKFGHNEALRIETDDPHQMLRFATDRELIQRMIDVNVLFCGTAEQVREQIDDLRHCYAEDGNLEWLVWEFWGQGSPGDEAFEIPRRQIELYGRHIVPHIG